MRLWLLCCALLFITAQTYDWISHQSWFITPHLSLPWIILGGVGLAIASNHSTLKAISGRATEPGETLPVHPNSSEAVSSLPTQKPEIATTQSNSQPKTASISFEISKQKHPHASAPGSTE
ncbi:MAG: hypothetical protein F6K42_32015 [Leptolyngbya sp. SIO1D8]|nr:hypothetical protein [Leptolyngbya sp. SIO1D8]